MDVMKIFVDADASPVDFKLISLCHQGDIDLWEMYQDYIDGKRKIAEINVSN